MRGVFGRPIALCTAAALCSLGSVAQAQQSVGADVIVGELPDLSQNTASGGIDAFAVGTTSCNKGNTPLNWFTGGTDNRHPVIGQNVFRLANGRFEQVGQAWLKHGFTALQGNVCVAAFGFACTATAGTTLGTGCSDPYSSGLNNGQSGLGPKWQVNASTGLFPYPFSSPAFSGTIARRLQINTTDLGVAGARYFIEGQYICGDDALAGNDNNNASYREVTFSGGPSEWTIAFAANSTTQREKPGIQAWKDIDATVTLVNADVANDGRFIVGCKVTQSGVNYTYEYAIQNLNSHRSAASFTVPYPSGTATNTVGFHDIFYHSGEPNSVDTDWTPTAGATNITWAGPAYSGTPPVYTTSGVTVTSFTAGTGNDHTANALRWGTLFNFRFTTTVAPANGTVQIGLFRPGTPSSVTVAVPTPGGATVGAATGPCCVGTTCTVTTPAGCGGTFGTIGATCSPNPCASGSCCAANGACTVTTQAACSGTWTSAGTCSPNNCPAPTGACCAANGSCSVTTPAACVGSYRGDGVTCAAANCVAVPSNDTCSTAQGLCDGVPVHTNNATATSEGTAACASSSGSDLWFRYAPSGTTGTVSVTFTTDNAQITGGTTAIDTVVSVFSGTCGTLTEIACDDDSGTTPGLSSRAIVTLTRGQTYFVRVAGFGTVPATGNISVMAIGGTGTTCNAGTGSCCVGTTCTVVTQASCTGTWTSGGTCTPSPCNPSGSCCSAGNCSVGIQSACNGVWTLAGTCSPNPCAPLNDDCANRAGLGLGTLAFDTTNATTDGIAHNPTCLFFGNDQITKDIWYNHPSLANGTLVIDTCGSTFDTKIAVYSGFGCLDYATRLIACNDDATAPAPNGCGAGSLQSSVSIPVVAGEHYTIRIGGYNNAAGLGQVTLTLTPSVVNGSCCAADGTCSVTTQAACTGTWTTGGVCSPNTCPQPTGACCVGTACSITTQAACSGTFQGVSSTCGDVGNPVICCPANFNHVGGLTVQDIFDFLAAYFGNSAMADFNSSGTITVQDIFDFLAAYFAGCVG